MKQICHSLDTRQSEVLIWPWMPYYRIICFLFSASMALSDSREHNGPVLKKISTWGTCEVSWSYKLAERRIIATRAFLWCAAALWPLRTHFPKHTYMLGINESSYLWVSTKANRLLIMSSATWLLILFYLVPVYHIIRILSRCTIKLLDNSVYTRAKLCHCA